MPDPLRDGTGNLVVGERGTLENFVEVRQNENSSNPFSIAAKPARQLLAWTNGWMAEQIEMSNSSNGNNLCLTGDGAKQSLAQDEFNLEKIAKSIAAMLLGRITADGYAIGIEGEWGSGKTSLANFIVDEIRNAHAPYHKLILYDPWLVGKRDGLLAVFFDALISKIRELGCDATVTGAQFACIVHS